MHQRVQVWLFGKSDQWRKLIPQMQIRRRRSRCCSTERIKEIVSVPEQKILFSLMRSMRILGYTGTIEQMQIIRC